ncbi:hypothetical protein ACHAWF_010176 [Thalassiosira exigua]
MRGRKLFGFGALAYASVLFALLLNAHGHLQPVVAGADAEEGEGEPTCSLDPSAKGDCDDSEEFNRPSANYREEGTGRDVGDLTRRVVDLTDDNFDDLTLTSAPATWLIMFKTDACGICKKAKPVLEELSVDASIVDHNDRELEAITNGQEEKPPKTAATEKENGGTPKGPVYVYEKSTGDEGQIPRGPVYVATIDANWFGRDITKRFGVDATPTILLLRNEGWGRGDGASGKDRRSYYVYRGQRATYPLRTFVLGEFAFRKKMDVPPPLVGAERKPRSWRGKMYDYLLKSRGAKWAGGIIGKILMAWFAFIFVLGVIMMVHYYAWGGDAADDDERQEERERELEAERAQGRKECGASSPDERSARRQKIMWERKAENRAKFAALKEAKKKKKQSGDEGGDDDLQGVGFAVKKSDARKLQNELSSAKAKAKDS